MEPELAANTLQGRTIILPGSRDKEGRPLILITICQDSPPLKIASSLEYLLSIFSQESKQRGVTVVTDARKGPWKVARSTIRQINATFSPEELAQLIVLRPDAFWDKQRVENCTSTQKDAQVVFIPRSRLNKFVDQSQLPFELGGCFIYNHEQWIENRLKVDEFSKDTLATLRNAEEFHQFVKSSRGLKPSEAENVLTASADMAETTKMLLHQAIERGREVLQKIECDNRNRKLASESDAMVTPQDITDTIEKIENMSDAVRRKQAEIADAWKCMQRGFTDTKDLCALEEGVVRVINWILGPAENLLNSQRKVGYDVPSAEDLRNSHEAIELQCWDTYGTYAELLHKIDNFTSGEIVSTQHKDLIWQKDFMDFVCRSFATRLERRRNILITSLRFFRLVSEYFDKTSEVFESLVMGNKVEDFSTAGVKLKKLQDNQISLDVVERELVKDGEKLSDMLSMPVKDALGREITVDYSEDIVNVRDILDATTARKNLFSDSVELQKLTLEQVTHIDAYEKDASQAIQWLDELFQVMLQDHGHVGCTVYEIQSQKDGHQLFQETAKDTYNYGCQLLNASLALRQSCKLPLDDHSFLFYKLRISWQRLLSVSQEQMTRLRVSAVFHRSVEDHCNQLRDLREAVATMPLEEVSKKKIRVRNYFAAREKLLVEVGRMVRLGRLLRSRLREPLYYNETMSDSASSADKIPEILDPSMENNTTAVEAISEKLSEVTGLAEELDFALRSAQQDCGLLVTNSIAAATSTITSTSPLTVMTTTPASVKPPEVNVEDTHQGTKPLKPDELKSDEEFLTASECTLQHSRSSSYNTASECEHRYSPWWEFDSKDLNENIVKEKMVLGVGLPELPPAKSVLKPSPEVPPGKIAREVTETTHLKVQHSHTLGVSSFVLTSETVREKGAVATHERVVKVTDEHGRETIIPMRLEKEGNEEEFMKRVKECGDWIQLKILEVTPELTALGANLAEALELQKAHDEVLNQLQNKQSPVEELLRQADQLISTQKPRAEVYAAMAESLGRAWKDVNVHLELRKQILDLNVQYHIRAQEFFERIDALEASCIDTVIPIDIEAVKNFLTNIHDLRRAVLESLMGALQAGNSLLTKLKELGAEGTLDSRPDRIRISVKRAISQVQSWLDELHGRRQVLEATFIRRKTQLEQCLALAILAADLRELEDIINERRDLLLNMDQLGDSSSSAELLQHELRKLLPEAKQLQERALKITKATEQLVASGCFAGAEATAQAYEILSATSDYLSDLEQRNSLLERVVAFFRSAQTALSKLDQLEVQLTTSELSSTSAQLAHLHSRCAQAVDEITSSPIAEGHSILNVAGRAKTGAEGLRRMVEELENRKIFLDGLCTAHREEKLRVNQALNAFLEKQNELYSWLVSIAEAFLQGHQDMGSDLPMAQDFLDLHNKLLDDLQTKGNEINTLLLTLPPLLEYLEDAQRVEVDSKVEELHDHWLKLKNILEKRLDLAAIYVKFHTEADIVNREMNNLEDTLSKNPNSLTEETIRKVEEKWGSLVPLYQSTKSTGFTFIDEALKVSEPHLDTKRACVCVESVLERLSQRQLTVTSNWQSFQTEIIEKRELVILWELNMAESTKTINWVSKLDSQLYPVITTSALIPKDIEAHIHQKLETVLPEIKRAQAEVENRIKTAESLIAKTPNLDEQSRNVKNKLIELNQRLIGITTDYQILLQILIAYFNNITELDKNIDELNTQFNEVGLPSEKSDLEELIRDNETSKQIVSKMFSCTQNECEQIVDRIRQQEPENVAEHDIEKLQYVIEIRQSRWEEQCRNRKELLEGHRQLCQFDCDLHQINEVLDDLGNQLSGVKGQYGESLAGAKATSLGFISFEKTIELLGKRIESFVNTGEQLLNARHVDSPHIQRSVGQLQARWNNLKKQVEETRRLIDLSNQYFQLVEEADDWFKEGSRLLVTIARKSTTVKQPEEAQQLLNEIEVFLKPGEAKQDERINKISNLAKVLYGQERSEQVTQVLIENHEMLESFTVINSELNTLVLNLKAAEDQRQRFEKEQEELEANLAAAKAEAEAALAAATAKAEADAVLAAAADEARKAAQAAAEEARKVAAEEAHKAAQAAAEEARKAAEASAEEARKVAAEEARKAAEAAAKALKEAVVPEKVETIVKFTQIHETPAIQQATTETRTEVVEISPQLEPPVFTSPLTDAVIEEGNKFTFICQLTGVPLPVVTWYKAGISIQNNPDYQTTFDQGVCTLTIEETFAEDSAKYTCKGINAVGSAETSATLSVKETEPEEQLIPPSFVRFLEPATAKEGSKFQFICKVEGNPLPTVQWFKNSDCIDNSPDYVITYNNGEAILKFEEIFLEDKAEYTCKASNELGIAQSTASLSVEPLKPTECPAFTVPLSNIMARAGQKVKLECVVSGLPPPALSWSHNGKPVKETRDVKLQSDDKRAILLISEAFPKDAGTYVVTATNIAGEATSACNVTVKGRLPTETSDSELASDMEPIKPSIQLALKDLSIFEGKRVRLDCVIVGQPEPEVIWYHDDRPVKESQDFQLLFQGDRCSLIIQEAYSEDAGEYKVVALNSAGEASSKCNLTITPLGDGEHETKAVEEEVKSLPGSPPKFSKLLSDVLVSEGDKVIFEATVTGEPRPEIKWLLNNQDIFDGDHFKITHDGDGNVKLVIDKVLPEDKGVYTVKASNPSGDAKCFAQLIVKSLRPVEAKKEYEEIKTAPTFREVFHDRETFEDTTTKFECIVTGKPAPKVRWFFNDEPVSGKDFLISTSGERQVLSIPNITKANEGNITCIAENEVGKATCTAALSVQPISIITLPEDQFGKEITQQTETSYSLKRELHVQSATSATSKIITSSSSEEPHVQIHTVKAEDQQLIKQINQEAPQIIESHKREEIHQIDKQPPVVQEKSISTVKIGEDQKTESFATSEQTVVYKPVIKARPPKFVTPVIGKIVDQGAHVILEGILDAFPTPEVSWTKNGVELRTNEDVNISFELNRAKIELKDVNVNDAGRYTCSARNEAGTAVSTSDLVIKKSIFPPVFGRRLQAQVVKKGDRVIFEVEVSGTPEPVVTWFKDGLPIEDALKTGFKISSQGICYRVTFDRVDLSHSGKYMARAVNSGGEAQSIADFAVFEPTPDTMVEVVKTVVFEDVRKHETLTSAADQSKTTFTTTKPIAEKIPEKPILTEPISDHFSQSLSKAQYETVTEQTISQKSRTIKLEHTVPELPTLKPYEPIKTIETISHQIHDVPITSERETTTIQTDEQTEEPSIETSSISKQSSLDFFVKKLKESDEPTKPKEIIKGTPLQPDIYTKFEETTNKIEVKEEAPKGTIYQPATFEKKSSTQESQMYQKHYSAFSSTQSQKFEEFSLTPEPPPEMCYAPKQEIKVDDVTANAKRLEEHHKEPAEIPPGGVKIFPTPISKPVESVVKRETYEKKVETYETPSFTKQEMTLPVFRQQADISTRALSPKPSAEALEMEKLWAAPKALEPEPMVLMERPVSVGTGRPLSGLSEASADARAMEKAWAHKFSETHMEKSWPPPQTEESKIQQSYSVQSTLEKKWTPGQKFESAIKETKSFVEPTPVPHYVAKVSHLHEQQFSQSSLIEKREFKETRSEMQKEFIIEEHNAKPSEIIKSWPPGPKEDYETKPSVAYKPLFPSMDSLQLRPVSVQDITDEVYLEPGPPPEIGFAKAPAERRQSYVETIEQDLEKNLEREPSKVLPGAVRTIPPPRERYVPPALPPKKELPQAPPIPPKPAKAETPKKVNEIQSPRFEKFPKLEPFPYRPEPEKPKPVRTGPPPTPSKFIKGRFTDSDYESDFESIKIPAKWRPCTSDTEEFGFRSVRAPKLSPTSRARSTDPEPLPPSKFEQPPEFRGPPRPSIDFERTKQLLKKESEQVKKQVKHFTKSHEVKVEISPPAIKPGSPPIFVEPKPKPDSPKLKHKPTATDGYMADTDEPFTLRRKSTKTEYKQEECSKTEYRQFYRESVSESSHQNVAVQSQPIPKPIPPKVTHYKKHISSAAASKKELVSTPIITSVSTTTEKISQKEGRTATMESFPFKAESVKYKKPKGPPPASPSKFMKGEFRESDYESDYEGRIPPVWRPSESDTEPSYKPVRPVLTPSERQSQTSQSIRTPTPPTEFDHPPQISGPPRPKFEPIEKPKSSVKLDEILKPTHTQQVVHKPTPVSARPAVTNVVAVPRLQPGSPPEIVYAPGPKRTQYYRATASAPYTNAVQTETSNAMHFDETTEHSHRTVSVQQTTKVIKFGEQNKKREVVLEPFPFKTEPERLRRSSVPPPPKPTKFYRGEFRESDYESEVESAKIKPLWAPPDSDSEEPQYRRVRAPHPSRSHSVPGPRERVLTPMEFDSQPPFLPQSSVLITEIADERSKSFDAKKRFEGTKSSQIMKQAPPKTVIQPGPPPEYGYVPEKITKATATKMASQYMDNMTHTFKSKAQQFANDIMSDVNKKQAAPKPIVKKTAGGEAQVYKEETRAAQYGTKHVDPDTGLIYFKYDFGYEFGIVLPGEGKNGEIPVPKKTIIEPPKRSFDIEMPVYHETSQSQNQSQPKPPNTRCVKWEPTSESDMSEYEGEATRKKQPTQGSRWEQSSASPVSLSPSLPSTSPAFNSYTGSGMWNSGRRAETPPSAPSTPVAHLGNQQPKRAPLFITPLRDIAVVSGQTARFECIVQSEVSPNILWSKNGRIIENSNDYQLHYRNGVCRLTIPQAYPEDAGIYTCTATNQIGAVGTTATLQVPGERRSTYLK